MVSCAQLCKYLLTIEYVRLCNLGCEAPKDHIEFGHLDCFMHIQQGKPL